jgi:glycerophosphoryl diester phosphodiesterase
MMRVAFVAARTVSVLCVLLLVVLIVFDAHAERFTAGLTPLQFSAKLQVDLRDDYRDVLGVAHNAGDDLPATFEAAALGVDAIEIDVTSVGGELHASHDAPVRRFLAMRRDRRLIIQTRDSASLRVLARTVPRAQRLQLIFDERELERLHRHPELVAEIDGVSVRDRLLSPPEQAWLRSRGLKTFAWTINDERRMNELVAGGVDGLITDRLDIMALLGDHPDNAR